MKKYCKCSHSNWLFFRIFPDFSDIFLNFLRKSRRTQRENATIPADPGETEFVIFSSSKQENRKKNVFGPDRLPSVALQQQRKLKKEEEENSAVPLSGHQSLAASLRAGLREKSIAGSLYWKFRIDVAFFLSS